MIKFLIQHASALEEKEGGLGETDLGADLEIGSGVDSLQIERSRVTRSFMRDIQNSEYR